MNHTRRMEIFHKVREQYLGLLTGVLWKLSGERELFAEAMQYALMGLWEHVEKLDRPTAASYVYRIALSANSKAWRQRIGRDGSASLERCALDNDPEARLMHAELSEQVRRALALLSTQQSQALVLRYLDQRDYADVAQQLGCSPAAARSHVSKALAAMKQKLSSQAGSEVTYGG